MKTWQEEAKGIEPSPRMKLTNGATFLGFLHDGLADVVFITDKLGAAGARQMIRREECVIDLANRHTRTSFEADLALRLGASEEDVNIGVLIWRGYATNGSGPRGWWWVAGHRDDMLLPVPPEVEDFLLARVLAWKSVA